MPRCRHCTRPVRFFEARVDAGELTWHRACFRCFVCRQLLPSRHADGFLGPGRLPFCAEHRAAAIAGGAEGALYREAGGGAGGGEGGARADVAAPVAARNEPRAAAPVVGGRWAEFADEIRRGEHAGEVAIRDRNVAAQLPARVGECSLCHGLVAEPERVERYGRIWHRACYFRCSLCELRLTTSTCFPYNGLPYCVDDYLALRAREKQLLAGGPVGGPVGVADARGLDAKDGKGAGSAAVAGAGGGGSHVLRGKRLPAWSENLTCPICFERLDSKLRRPALCPSCGQSFCMADLQLLAGKDCPLCRSRLPARIPLNVALRDLLREAEEKANAPDAEPQLEFLDGSQLTLQISEGLLHSGPSCDMYLGTYRGTRVVVKLVLDGEGATVVGEQAEEPLDRELAREVAVLISVHHPSIVTVFGLVHLPSGALYGGRIGLVSEYVRHGDLGQWLDERRVAAVAGDAGNVPSAAPVDEGNAEDEGMRESVVQLDPFAVALSILRALQFLHSLNIMHLALKPQNILVAAPAEGAVKLCDFGMARVVEQASQRGDWLGSRTVCGAEEQQQAVRRQSASPMAFAAPEFLRGEAVGPLSDVYSCGVVLWCLFARQADPYPRHSTLDILLGVAGVGDGVDIPPLSPDLTHIVCPSVRLTIERALARNPADRAGVAELIDRLVEAGAQLRADL